MNQNLSTSFKTSTHCVMYVKYILIQVADKYFYMTLCTTVCQLGSRSPSFEGGDGPWVDVEWRSFRARLVAGERASSPEEASCSVDPDTVVDRPPPVANRDKWAHIIHEPQKGCFVIATEKLHGVHIFERTIILVLATDPIGPTGIILNRPSLMSIKEMRSSTLDVVGTFSDRPLFFGGPLEQGFFLLSPKDQNDGVGIRGLFEEVMKGLYHGTKGSVGCAAEMVKRNVVGVEDLKKFFVGHCAWQKEQLGDEIWSGYWSVAACSPSIIGLSCVGRTGLWEEILGLVSPRQV